MIYLPTTKKGIRPLVPCGQCLHCRLDRRDKWVTRCLLESQSSIIGQFWTLTFSDEGLSTLAQQGARKLYTNFSAALKMREKRAKNPLQPRSFGVLEHGEILGRPHLHLLIWNHTQSLLQSTPVQEGLPRPRFTTELWPHGHVDSMPLNPKSCRYVCKYICKFETNPEEVPISFHCRKPALGYNGLELLVRQISKSPTRKWEHPSNIVIDGKEWALDQTMQKHYSRLMRSYRLRYQSDTLAKKELLRVQRNREKDEITWQQSYANLQKEETKLRTFIQTWELSQYQKLRHASVALCSSDNAPNPH
ncbi:replication initiator protein [Microviridae sp.]|nr:replication initiator protein [Microviridae sp.]